MVLVSEKDMAVYIVCGLHGVYGGGSVSRGRATTNGGHLYAFRHMPGISALGVMSPSRGGSYAYACCK
jgi:hypothetical protein